MADYRCLILDTDEYHRAWSVVHNTRFKTRKKGPVQSFEFWQYMGTFLNDDGLWAHQLRHRYHPATGQREIINVVCEDMSAICKDPCY